MFPADITTLLKGSTAHTPNPQYQVRQLLTDSRHTTNLHQSLFFAIPTSRNTGSHYVRELYDRGVRNFIVPRNASQEHQEQFALCTEANFWQVDNVVLALQQVAAHHRRQFHIPVVGITGSNGKTIVKDWIVQLLGDTLRITSNPRSYNSQIGVPLSVWQMSEGDQLAVFEAGISQVGEMERLREVICPTIGLFTNIGQAHDEHFLTRGQKIAEKLQLFIHCEVLIYSTDHKEIHSALSEKETFRSLRRFTWGHSPDADLRIIHTVEEENGTLVHLLRQGQSCQLLIPFTDRASVENALHCIALLCYLGLDNDDISARLLRLTPVAMRMELVEAIGDSLLVNDSYSLDLDSLSIALDYVQHERQHPKKALIISDIAQSGLPEGELYARVAEMARMHGISHLVGIGPALCRNQSLFVGIDGTFYPSTEECIQRHNFHQFSNETILLKGARAFHFEDIARLLQRRTHQTIMEVNLDNLISNLNYFRSLIHPRTKLMAMVKAASYGAGTVEVANALQWGHADYLTVAYSDEGVELRRNGITLPIMVMNPEEESFDDIIRYHLEPDIYSFRILEAFQAAVRTMGTDHGQIPVHIEMDSGMHRLGFLPSETNELIARLLAPDCVLSVRSLFSHLACSEDPQMDDFTRGQIDRFTQWSHTVRQALGDPSILCHILNSSGIVRFPQAQMDMVRLGIGLYGIAPQPEVQARLLPVSRLKTRISQLKHIPAGDSVGYNRKWVAMRDSTIAITCIGYADGLSRQLGYGNGRVLVAGQQVPIIGSICMDMCFLDVTGIDCHEGDEVTLFGDADLLQQMSRSAGTIPYEILTSVSPRVKRIYYQT